MVTVRPALVADVSAMGECMVATWLDAHRGHIPADRWDARRREWTPDVSAAGWGRTLDEIASGRRRPGTLLVADDGGDIVGIGLISVGSVSEVDALYVAPDRHGEGIGSALIGALAAAASQHCTTVELSVLAANGPARRFYERIGGELVESSTFDEDGTALPTVVYRWSIGDLVGLGPGPTVGGT